jgi:hypothetical protein
MLSESDNTKSTPHGKGAIQAIWLPVYADLADMDVLLESVAAWAG